MTLLRAIISTFKPEFRRIDCQMQLSRTFVVLERCVYFYKVASKEWHYFQVGVKLIHQVKYYLFSLVSKAIRNYFVSLQRI